MTGAVRDSSALLALLLNEPGAKVVTCVLDDALILSVTFAEVVGYYAEKGIDPAAIRSVLTSLPVRVVPFDQDLACETGRTRPMCEKAGLLLGDRVLRSQSMKAVRSTPPIGHGRRLRKNTASPSY